jgi:predicted permease
MNHPLDDLDDDIRDHIERETHDNIERGMSTEEARYAALRKFGNVIVTHEDTRAVWIPDWLDQIRQDVRFALRMIRRNPAFTAVVVLSLAIGIGANAAIFSIIDELLLKTLPVPAPEQLVLFNWLEGRKSMRTGMDGIRTTDAATGRSTSASFSYPTFLRLQEANRTLTELFAFYPLQQRSVVSGSTAEIASGQYVSGNYFQGLGIGAALGRVISPDDDRPGASPVATITDEYWRRRFDGDPRIVGQTVTVNRVAVIVIGVTPKGFAGTLNVTESPDFTLPFAVEPLMAVEGSDLQRPAFLWVRLMGRLKPGFTREQAAANLSASMQQSMLEEWQRAMAAQGPGSGGDSTRTLDDASTLRAESGRQGLMDGRRRYTQPLFLLMACSALVLLTACLNVANLLLARGTARHKEMSMRLALGARRGRLVRQLFTESMLLAIAGSAAALPLALWGTDLLRIWRPWGSGPLVLDNALNWRLLGFCGGVATLAGTLFGLVPAFRSTRGEVLHVTQRGPASASAPLMRAFVSGQIAISLVLVVAAGLFVGTLRSLHAVDKGFNADKLLLFRVQPQLNGYTPPEISGFYSRLVDRIKLIPGVRSATLSRHPLLSFSHRSGRISIEGVRATPEMGAEVNVVAPNFFETMEMPLLLGRAFRESDSKDALRVAVVNERFASQYFAGGNPIGHRVWLGAPNGDPIEIVGMARDAKYTDLRTPIEPTVYVPYSQDVPGQANFAVRTIGDPLALIPAVRQAAREIDAQVPLFEVKSQIDQAEESLAKEALFARLSTLLGSIAVLLAAVGLFGTMSYVVVRRTGEIGIRMALGADRRTIMRMVLQDAFAVSVAGAALGIPAALIASRAWRNVLDEILYGLQPNDPTVTMSAAAILMVVALVAGWLPAQTASKVDPVIALQSE